MDRIVQILVPSLFAIVVLLGVIGNSMVVIVVAINKQMRTSTNVLIVGLALADLLFLLACVPPTAIDYSISTWIFPSVWCQIINYLQHLFAYQTVWTLVLMALDRFTAVVLPIWSMRYRTIKNTSMLLALLWLLTSTGCVPIALQFEVIEYQACGDKMRRQCIPSNIMSPNKTIEIMLFYMSFNVFGYMLPLSLTTMLYLIMLQKLWVTGRPKPSGIINNCDPSKNIQQSSDNSRLARQARARRRVTRVVLGVTLTFAACWLPLNVGFLITGITKGTIFYEYGDIMIPVQIASQVLAYTNSCLNPILYAFLSEHFRTAFKDLLRRLLPKYLQTKLFANVPPGQAQVNIDGRTNVQGYRSRNRSLDHQLVNQTNCKLLTVTVNGNDAAVITSTQYTKQVLIEHKQEHLDNYNITDNMAERSSLLMDNDVHM